MNSSDWNVGCVFSAERLKVDGLSVHSARVGSTNVCQFWCLEVGSLEVQLHAFWTSVSFTFPPLCSEERAAASFQQESEWTAESVGLRWRTKNFPSISGIELRSSIPWSSSYIDRATQFHWHSSWRANLIWFMSVKLYEAENMYRLSKKASYPAKGWKVECDVVT
jgi:hypothetical protein